MPKLSYGPIVQKRSRELLEALLRYAAGEYEISSEIRDLEIAWQQDDSASPRLVVRATIHALQRLLHFYQQKAESAQSYALSSISASYIRNSLKMMSEFLGILIDHRVKTKGTSVWHFSLVLWSFADVESNLLKFDALWEDRRSGRSNEDKNNDQNLYDFVVSGSVREENIVQVRAIITHLMKVSQSVECTFLARASKALEGKNEVDYLSDEMLKIVDEKDSGALAHTQSGNSPITPQP